MRALAAVLLLPAAFFAWVFHERYWRWRDCFVENTQGRCWDSASEQVFTEGAGLVWGGLTAICLLLAALALLADRLLRARRAPL